MTFRLDRLGAHPRSRGENAASMLVGCQALGSSPLTRGKHRLPGRCHRRHGLIPAHAGKTTAITVRGMMGPAHPRSRGENPDLKADTVRAAGSSPLTRGKLAGHLIVRDGEGLIPAHAGKTCLA